MVTPVGGTESTVGRICRKGRFLSLEWKGVMNGATVAGDR